MKRLRSLGGSVRRAALATAALLVAASAAMAAGPALAAHSGGTSDTFYGEQWGPQQVRADRAWHTSTGGGTVIAVVDTGVDLGHEDLAGKLLPGRTFVNCDSADGCGTGDWGGQREEGDEDAHGTHVAGIAAAATSNGTGIAGVAPDAKLLPVKVLSGEEGNFADAARAIRWAANPAKGNADVVNLSFGAVILGLLPGSQVFNLAGLDEELEAVDEAIAYAHAQGAVVVAAAGNEAFPLCSDPAFASGALCVTATTQLRTRAEYSNHPINEGLLAVAAPGGGLVDSFFCGTGVLSTVPDGTSVFADACDYTPPYDEYIGTSMAAPHAAGVAALLLAQGCTRQQTLDLITSTAVTPVGAGEQRGTYTPVYGYGIVDAAAATAAARPTCTPRETTRPQVTSVSPAPGAIGVAPAASVSVKFSEPMNRFAAEDAFTLARASDGARVAGSFSWVGNTLVFDPTNNLQEGVTYSARVGTSATDWAGNSLASERVWSFRVLRSVTAHPSSVAIQLGSLRSGSAARLAADDDSYLEVNSTTSGTRNTAWYGRFTGVSNTLRNLSVSYKGKNSRSCSQSVSIWRWTTSSWVTLDSRSVGTTEALITKAPAGTLGDYVSGASGDGELRLRVSCATSAGAFHASADLMRISYERP